MNKWLSLLQNLLIVAVSAWLFQRALNKSDANVADSAAALLRRTLPVYTPLNCSDTRGASGSDADYAYRRCKKRCPAILGDCVAGACVCKDGKIGPNCKSTRDAWVSEMQQASDSGVGEDSEFEDKNIFHQWKYMETLPFRTRYSLAANYLHDCHHVLEVGGLNTPLWSFLQDNPASASSVTVLDPLAAPTAQCYNKSYAMMEQDDPVGHSDFRIYRNLPVKFSEYVADGSEDCFLFLGMHCHFKDRSVFELLQDMHKVVVDYAQGYETCMESAVTPQIADKFDEEMNLGLDLSKSQDQILSKTKYSNIAAWRLQRTMRFFKRSQTIAADSEELEEEDVDVDNLY